MIYNFKNDNYKNFDVFKDNVLKSRSYFIPFRDKAALDKTDIRDERYKSDSVDVLSGEWDFSYYSKSSLLPKEFDTDKADFDKVTVPSCWQFTGYEKPYYVNTRYQFTPNPPEIPSDCSVGVYRTFFNIEDEKENYILSFLGVAGSLDVYVNGEYVGYSEGSHNTSEFDVNPYIKAGSNELVVLVHKFSNGTYLECQDMFRNNGIFRDVLLYKYKDEYIYDFEAKTSYEFDKYNLLVSADIKGNALLRAELYFKGDKIASAESNDGKICFSSLDAKEWSAEIPNLYTLYLYLVKDGKDVEVIRRPIGFKHIEIKKNVFYFNDKKIKLLGVNHHDTDEKKGYVMNVGDLERDVRIFKEYNVNCVRTSHYPPDPIFLDLCDEYGVYVVDEADIEAHGCQTELHKFGACSHDPAWQPRYIDRVMRMFERDKNHPSITMWSLGNEAWGYLNQDACYKELKKRTPIPIHYENVIRTKRFAYDVISMMYPWKSRMKKLSSGRGAAPKWYKKPFFLCEYAHAMGLGAGDLDEYVKDFLRADNMLGGCIWEFADHAVYHENGPLKYTYGGDHGEEKHDSNFCVDGLFFPDRTPHAGALQMKNCYRPVRARMIGKNVIEFKNFNYFKDIDFDVEIDGWRISDEELNSGKFTLKLNPRQRKRMALPSADSDSVVITYSKDGFVIAKEELDINSEPLTKGAVFGVNDKKVSSKAVGNRLYADYDGGRFIFNLKSGEVESYTKNDIEYISAYPIGQQRGFFATAFRAPLDNDMYIKKAWEALDLQNENKELLSVDYYDSANNCVIEAKYRIFNSKCTLLKYVLKYIISGDGTLNIAVKCTKSKAIPFAPRFGLTLSMPKAFENVNYFGLGERENLPDFRAHAMLGNYTLKVDDMREKYIKPQESSMRCKVTRARVTDNEGHGLEFIPVGKSMIFSADNFTSYDCAKAKHQEELKLGDFTYLHFDAYQLGAGSNSCGPVTYKKYKKNSLSGCNLSMTVRPL